MWNRIKLRLEIIGYSRAIGAMSRESIVTKDILANMVAERDGLIAKLKTLKAQRKLPAHKRYMRGGTANA